MSSDAPSLTFDWFHRSRRYCALAGCLIFVLLAHGAAFYLFSASEPPLVRRQPVAVTLTILPPGSPEAQAASTAAESISPQLALPVRADAFSTALPGLPPRYQATWSGHLSTPLPVPQAPPSALPAPAGLTSAPLPPVSPPR